MQKLTKAEEDIMQIIWEIGPCTVSDIRAYLAKAQASEKPPHSTVSTIVRILEDKQVLGHKAYGRTYEYFALMSKADYSRMSVNKLLSDYFDGSVARLVSFVAKEKDIDLDELNKMLEALDE